MSLFKSVKVINSGKTILLSRKYGVPIRYHSTWLRDNANDHETRDKNNGQRLISISDIPINTYIKSAFLDKRGENLTINFLPNKKKFNSRLVGSYLMLMIKNKIIQKFGFILI